jgi:excisionase family DNA binding protein
VPGDALAEFAAWRQEAEREIARRLWEKDPLGAARAGVPPPPAPPAPASGATPAAPPAPSKSAPEFFASLDKAAQYAGVTKRTLSNWKKCGWLKVEQIGRKIRIARADVEKCSRRQ